MRKIDWSGLLRRERGSKAIRDAFGLLSSSGHRAETFRRDQQRETIALEKRIEQAEHTAIQGVRAERDVALQARRDRSAIERNELDLRHKMETAAIHAKWKQRSLDRREAWLEFDRTAPAAPEPKPLGERGQQVTRADAEIRSTAEDFMRKMREAREQRDRDQGRDDDRGR